MGDTNGSLKIVNDLAERTIEYPFVNLCFVKTYLREVFDSFFDSFVDNFFDSFFVQCFVQFFADR